MKRKFVLFVTVLALSLITIGCGPSDEEILTVVASAWTPTSESTETPVPTETPAPTETPKPTNTPLPEGVLFRDDFEGELQPDWEWENENSDKWTVTDDGWLQIIGEHDDLLYTNQQNNLLWHPLPKGDFVITFEIHKVIERFDRDKLTVFAQGKIEIDLDDGVKVNYCKFEDILYPITGLCKK